MTARLGNTEGSADSNDSDEAVPNAVSPELHSALVTVIDDITSSRDKMGAIRKLHILIQSNPSLDVSLYLERTSAVFRRYVLDTLQKMDEHRAKPDSAAGADSENSSNTAPAGDGQNRCGLCLPASAFISVVLFVVTTLVVCVYMLTIVWILQTRGRNDWK